MQSVETTYWSKLGVTAKLQPDMCPDGTRRLLSRLWMTGKLQKDLFRMGRPHKGAGDKRQVARDLYLDML